jgi:anti-anti-sigma factor
VPDPSPPSQLPARESIPVALQHAFSCSRRAESGGSIRLVLAGELDLGVREHFKAAVADAQLDSGRVLLDLGALTLIDCATLGALFAAAARSRRDDAVLILLSPRGQVRRVLDLIGAPRGVVVMAQSDLPSTGLRVEA